MKQIKLASVPAANVWCFGYYDAVGILILCLCFFSVYFCDINVSAKQYFYKLYERKTEIATVLIW